MAQGKNEQEYPNPILRCENLNLSRPAGRQGLVVRPQNFHPRSRRVAVPVVHANEIPERRRVTVWQDHPLTIPVVWS
jgi:hypothetical protein